MHQVQLEILTANPRAGSTQRAAAVNHLMRHRSQAASRGGGYRREGKNPGMVAFGKCRLRGREQLLTEMGA